MKRSLLEKAAEGLTGLHRSAPETISPRHHRAAIVHAHPMPQTRAARLLRTSPAGTKSSAPLLFPALPQVLTAPDSTATLGWVHGYRSQDMRGNLRYAGSSMQGKPLVFLLLCVRMCPERKALALEEDVFCGSGDGVHFRNIKKIRK